MKRLVILLFILLLACMVGFPVARHLSTETLTVTITEKERVVTGSGAKLTSKYLVFTDKEVFQNTDTLVHFKFNSSDIQGKLNVGMTCPIYVYGWRIPFLSSYRNIVRVGACT